jgi:SRSO17 transposase
MTSVDFEPVARTFADFHRRFAPFFGRKEARQHSEQYVRGLLVQHGERRNAENLAEAVDGATPRALQRFLTEAPWSSDAVREELQSYLGERLQAAEGTWVLDDTGFPKQGKRSVGVARQYSGTLGKVGNCQVGVFLAYVSERGHALVDGELYLLREWTDDAARCRAAGVPEEVGYRSKAEIALALLRRAKALGRLTTRWVTADEAYGEVPSFRDALADEDYWYVLEVPCTTSVFRQASATAVPPWRGRGRKPTRPRVVPGATPPQPVRAVAAALVEPWTTIVVAEGAQGPRVHEVTARRVWESREGLPGRECWLVLRRNLDGSELKYYLSNAPADALLATLARIGAWRWSIETEFQMEKAQSGLDEYEVRSWQGWHHHIVLALLAGAFLLTLEQDWGGKAAPDHSTPGRSSAAGVAAPADVDPARPRPVAARYAAPQRAGQTFPCQTSLTHAA